MTMYDFVWLFMTMSSSSYILNHLKFYKTSFQSLIPYDHVQPYMTKNEYVWPSMTMYDYVWVRDKERSVVDKK